MRRILAALLFMGPVALWAQLEPNTLTITATRQLNAAPDQLGFSVSVTTPQTASLDQVVGALQGLGITASNFSGLGSAQSSSFIWSFVLAVSIDKIPTLVQSLVSLQGSIGKSNSGWTMSYFSQGLQISNQLQQSLSCSKADLISDATAKAQKIAAAAGRTLGPIQTLSDGGGVAVIGAIRVGDFVGVSNFVQGVPYFAPSPPATCTAVVKFQLLQ